MRGYQVRQILTTRLGMYRGALHTTASRSTCSCTKIAIGWPISWSRHISAFADTPEDAMHELALTWGAVKATYRDEGIRT
jgi:hypothetical protein